MDLYWWSSWASVFVQPLWAMPRFGREALLRILIVQPLEFRIKILTLGAGALLPVQDRTPRQCPNLRPTSISAQRAN